MPKTAPTPTNKRTVAWSTVTKGTVPVRRPRPMAEPQSIQVQPAPDPPPIGTIPAVILLRPSWLDMPLGRIARRLLALAALLLALIVPTLIAGAWLTLYLLRVFW